MDNNKQTNLFKTLTITKRPKLPPKQQQNTVRKPLAGKHDLKPKQTDKSTLSKLQNNRYKPYTTAQHHNNRADFDDDDEDDLSEWTLDENLKRIIYDDNSASKVAAASSRHRGRPAVVSSKQAKTYSKPQLRPAQPIREAEIAPRPVGRPPGVIAGDYELAQLLREEQENDALVAGALQDLARLEGRTDDAGADYINRVDLDELSNKSSSLANEFIDWDEIDDLLDRHK